MAAFHPTGGSCDRHAIIGPRLHRRLGLAVPAARGHRHRPAARNLRLLILAGWAGHGRRRRRHLGLRSGPETWISTKGRPRSMRRRCCAPTRLRATIARGSADRLYVHPDRRAGPFPASPTTGQGGDGIRVTRPATSDRRQASTHPISAIATHSLSAMGSRGRCYGGCVLTSLVRQMRRASYS